MELYEIKNGLEKAHLLLQEFYQSIDIEAYKREIEGLTQKTLQENFWDDANTAKKIYDQLSSMNKIVDMYQQLDTTYNGLLETYTLVKETEDVDFQEVLESDYQQFSEDLKTFEKSILLSKEHDSLNAIVEIHPGAGGTESQDWAEMLFRMYQRYADKKDYKIEVLEYLAGDVAGIKSVSFLVKGYNAYGHLKAEKGVHRLVRLSPFDSAKRRHTSFAAIDVMPELDNSIEVDIRSEDIQVDTYRASGAGGQHVNTTDSAVRMTHIPTGIVVTCQSQRSQIQNREQAMVMLKSKLYQLMVEQQLDAINDLKGEQKEIAWGSQIRSYVLHPYSLVKDARSHYESNNPKDVLDGNLDEFIYAYLKTTFKEV
ncbi:MAG: peptide chain release factor 2 [Coprobacillaceae bacterium]